MLDTWDVVARLTSAMAFGVAIGLNRRLHHKATGMRTLGLVSLGSALIVLAFVPGPDGGSASRVAQGLVTGIGFLGAGVIVRGPDKIHGLTTAASIWFTALIGAACGLGAWTIVLTSAVLVTILFTFGGPLERRVHAWFDAHGGGGGDDQPEP